MRARATAGGRRGEERGAENSQIPTLPGKSPSSSQALSFPAQEIPRAGAKQQVGARSGGQRTPRGAGAAALPAPASQDPAVSCQQHRLSPAGHKGSSRDHAPRPRGWLVPPTVGCPDAAALPIHRGGGGDHPSLPQPPKSSPSADSLFIPICSRPDAHVRIPQTPGRVPAWLRGCVRAAARARARWHRGRGFLPGPWRTGEGPRDGQRALPEREKHGASHGPRPPSHCLLRGAGTGAHSHPGKGRRQILMEAEMPLP